MPPWSIKNMLEIKRPSLKNTQKTSCNDTPHSVQFSTRENKCHRQHTLSPIPTSSHQDHLFDVGPNPLESLVVEYVPTELWTRNLAQHDM